VGAAPDAVLVVDRFQLLVNMRAVSERYVHRVGPELRWLLMDDAAKSDPMLLDAPPSPRCDYGRRSARSVSGASGRSRRPASVA